MNDLQHDPDVSALDQAAINDRNEKQAYEDSQDYQAFKELKNSPAFARFLRRIRMKREAIEKSVIDGVKTELYSYCVDRIALLKEIENLAESERLIAWKAMHPGKPESPDYVNT